MQYQIPFGDVHVVIVDDLEASITMKPETDYHKKKKAFEDDYKFKDALQWVHTNMKYMYAVHWAKI